MQTLSWVGPWNHKIIDRPCLKEEVQRSLCREKCCGGSEYSRRICLSGFHFLPQTSQEQTANRENSRSFRAYVAGALPLGTPHSHCLCCSSEMSFVIASIINKVSEDSGPCYPLPRQGNLLSESWAAHLGSTGLELGLLTHKPMLFLQEKLSTSFQGCSELIHEVGTRNQKSLSVHHGHLG